MTDRLINADNQICFRALCGMEVEQQAASGRRKGVIALAMRAMRKVSRRNGYCIDCPYNGRCGEPDSSDVVPAGRIDSHVPIKDVRL